MTLPVAFQTVSLVSDTDGFCFAQSHFNESDGQGKRMHGCSGYDDDDVEATNFDNPNLADSEILVFQGN